METYRIRPDAPVYFLTYSIVEWLPLFVTPAAFKIVTDSLTYCHGAKNLRINAFVIMPTHLHLVVFDAEFRSDRLIESLADFRKFTGRQLSDFCSRQAPKSFAETLRQAATADRERRLWQPSRHPEAIAEQWFWRQKVDYLHDNPCRKQLVRQPDHWRYSSAAWYASEGTQLADVPLTAIDW
jgi:REP-associated tyrosine transposase